MFQAVRIRRRETCDLYDNPIRQPETVYGITSLTAQQANRDAVGRVGLVRFREGAEQLLDQPRPDLLVAVVPGVEPHLPHRGGERATAQVVA